MGAVLGTIAACALVLNAAVAAGFFLVRAVVVGGFTRWREWLLIWIPSLLPLALIEFHAKDPAAALSWLGQLALVLLAGWGFHAEVSAVHRGLWASLVIAVGAFGLAHIAAPRVWVPIHNPNLSPGALVASATHSQRLRIPSVRRWTLAPGSDAVTLGFRFAERKTSPSRAWIWGTHGPVTMEPLSAEGPDASRLHFGSGDDPYVMKSFDFGRPVAGVAFRLSLEVRADSAIQAHGCRGIWLQVWGSGGAAKCKPISVDKTWKPHSLVWTAPAGAESHVIRVALNDFNGMAFDVRDVHLFKKTPSGWEELGPLLPGPTEVSLAWTHDGTQLRRTVGLPPNKGEQRFRLKLSSSPTTKDTVVAATIRPPVSTSVTVTSTHLEVAGADASPIPSSGRLSLWFGQPNLAGHSLAALSLVAFLLSATLRDDLLLFLTGATAVWLTGSRTAFVAVVAGMAALLLVRYARRSRWVSVVMILAVLGSLLVVGSTLMRAGAPLARVLPFNEGQKTPRTAIWDAGLQAMAAYPVTGLAGASSNFRTYWRTSSENTSGETITHAHDLWLQFGSRYGAIGLLCSLWITFGLLYLGWRRARAEGLIFVSAILFLNVFDYTLFYAAVLLGLVLGLNVISPHREHLGD